ncbi:MAG TPA: CHAT domain-containing protein [Blastocatellia bacterium]|nr:CHAT domain-containing protein [Blastocatellia bacterium]
MNIRSYISLLFSRSSLFKLQVFVAFIIFSLPASAQEIQPDVRQLVVGERTERKVLGQEFHIYGVELKQGQVLRVTFLEKGTDIVAVIVRAADQKKDSAAANSGYGFMRESLTLIARQDGVYALVVRAQQITKSNAGAGYEMTATLSDQASERDSQRAQAENLLEGANQIFIANDSENFPTAIANLEQSLKIWRLLGDKYWEGVAGMNIGNTLMRLENFSKAETYLSEALKLFEAAGNEPEVGALYASLATLYAFTKNEEKARTYMAQALKVSRSLGDTRSEELLNLINLRASSEGNKGGSYNQELAEARAKKDRLNEASIWARTVYNHLTDDSIDDDERSALFERAEREALPLFKEINDRDVEMQILVWLGLGLPEAASESADEEEMSAIEERASNYLRQALLISKARNNHLIQAIAYQGLNVIYEGKNDRLAIFLGKKMLNSIQELRQTLKAVDKETQQDLTKKFEEAYDTLAGDLFSEGRLEEAQQVINLSRDQEFFDFKLTQNQIPARLALTYREAENAQLFDSAVERITVKYGDRPEANYRSAADELKAVFSRLEQNFSAPASEKDIARKVPDTADMQLALRELHSKTGKKYATIYLSSDSTNVLLITPESIKGFWIRNIFEEAQNSSSGLYQEIARQARAGLLSKEEVEKKLEEAKEGAKRKLGELSAEQSEETILDFLASLRSPNFDPRPLGSMIYRGIFKKVELNNFTNTLEAELAQYKPDVLLWSLSGDMRYIPVAALYDAEKKEYLIEKYQNAVFTRARKERFLIEPRAWAEGVGFGTSVAHGDFSPLAGVTREISTIFGDAATRQEGLFKGRVFLNGAFTRQAFLTIPQTKPALIHIASHFSFQPGDARNSFLLLGDGSKFSLIDMQLNFNLFEGVDLLTLSACETAAQQPNANGKEIDGFAELAQRLGASSVIATLWKVSDDGTSKLMSEFYRLRRENPAAPKSEILRQAQLHLLNGKSSAEEGARRRSSRGPKIVEEKGKIPFKPAAESPLEHPYYWAPFVLFGSSR